MADRARSTSSRSRPSSPGVHPQTLRIYERKGLLEPGPHEGRSRRYSDRDIALLRRIQELTNEASAWPGSSGSSRSRTELDRLQRRAPARTRRRAREAVARTHRSYRRDLVPVSRAVVPIRPRR